MNATEVSDPSSFLAANTVELPDPSDSSENDSDGNDEETPQCSKRQRSNKARIKDKTIHHCNYNKKNDWDAFVQSGAKLKAFATSILDAARQANSYPSTATMTPNEHTEDNSTKELFHHPQVDEHTAKLAYDKTAECMILDRKLKELQAQQSAVNAANTSLRESTNATNERLERTVDALRIAGSNAVKARADADAAEAYAASLASQLESLRHVVHETKRATKILQDEHEQVAAATRSLESTLLIRETELFHLHKDRKTMASVLDQLKKKMKGLSNDKSKLTIDLESMREQIKSRSREMEERDALEQARKDRSAVVEKELRDARSLLTLASSAAVETETTTSALKETIDTFVQENQSLHDKIDQIQQRFRSNEERLQESLAKSENSAHALRIKAASHDEQVNQLLSEKAGYEKQLIQLKGRITNLETRLRDAAAFSSPPPGHRTVGGEPSTERKTRKIEFNVPSLTPVALDKSPSLAKSRQCCLCFKVASGMMKSCQCGNPRCDKRAHSACLSDNPRCNILLADMLSTSKPVVLCTNSMD